MSRRGTEKSDSAKVIEESRNFVKIKRMKEQIAYHASEIKKYEAAIDRLTLVDHEQRMQSTEDILGVSITAFDDEETLLQKHMDKARRQLRKKQQESQEAQEAERKAEKEKIKKSKKKAESESEEDSESSIDSLDAKVMRELR